MPGCYSLPQAVRTRINGLKGVQVAHAKIETEFQLEILKLEKKASTIGSYRGV